ncbi:TonB-dependent receptor [uncultured Microscilla sp.]|uniref:TonB-dependent receptor n=1 Tax=uncultured Microscilla sp. TaxID=432653 RepID=UPI00261AAFEA|nr:TonB-dependent receptor [uncultured Microscilla sp.]
MMNSLRYLLILILLTSFSAYSQQNTGTISGTVKTKEGNNLHYVSLLLEGANLGSTTNSLGVFTIDNVPTGTYKLIVSRIGYQTIKQEVTVTAGATSEVNLNLSEKNTRLNEIQVRGKREWVSESLNKIDVPLKYLPITANTVSKQLMVQRGVDDLGEAVKSTPGVRPINRYGGFQTFHIRGFNNFVLLTDGVRDERHNISTSAPSTNLANVERIEVLKGPASVLFGHSALGGVINIVRNQPSPVFTADFSAAYGSFNTRRLQAGAGGPINSKWSYRVDFGLSESDGFRDYGTNTNNFYAAVQYRPRDGEILDIRMGLNKDTYDTDTGLPVLENGSLVPGMNINNRYNDPQDFLNHTRYDFQVRYVKQLSKSTKISNQLSYYWDDIDYFSTEELTFNATQDSLTRSFPFYFNHRTKPLQNQLELTHDFSIGNIEQKLLVGYSISLMDRKTYRGDIFGEGKFTTVAVQNPILNQGYIDHRDTRYQAKLENVHGIYVQDWLNIGNHLKALIGLRYDIFNGTYFDDEVDVSRNVISEGEKTNIPSQALTYRAGLVYEPIEQFSIFSGYSTYFKPSRRITGDGQVFDPETGFQAEIGSRYYLSTYLTMTLSGFYLRKNNIVENLGGGVFRQVGSADSKGVEIEVNASPLDGFTINAGYAYTDISIREFEGDATNPLAGNRIAYAPDHLANFWANYEIPKGLLRGFGISAGLYHTGKNFTAANNTYALPAYTILDGSIFYNFGKGEIRLNINNITDQIYFRDAIYGNQFFPGLTRNYLLTIRYRL